MRVDEHLTGQGEKVRRLFDQSSEDWAKLYTNPVKDVSQLELALRANIVRRMLSEVAARSDAAGRLKLLDMGCGSGHVLDGLDASQYDVVGADFSEGMVRNASGSHPDRSFCVADARMLPLASGSLDVVTLIGVLEYIPNYDQVIKGISRVLRPGGSLVLSVPNAWSLFRQLHTAERAVSWPLRSLARWARTGRFLRLEEERRYRQFRWTEATTRTMLAAHGLDLQDSEYCAYFVQTPFLEASRANVALCRWASARYRSASYVSRHFARTIVFSARKRCVDC